jgi:ankyrin repeat protein
MHHFIVQPGMFVLRCPCSNQSMCLVVLQDGRTALHLSAGQGHSAVIRDLLRKGADPLRRDMVSRSFRVAQQEVDSLCSSLWGGGVKLSL